MRNYTRSYVGVLVNIFLPLGLLGCVSFYGFFTGATLVSAATCSNYYQSNIAVPTGYGAAYDPLTGAKELLVQADCSGPTPMLKVGSSLNIQYIYKLGYAYKGGVWQQVPLTGSGALIGSNWYQDTAQGALPFTTADLANWSYVVGYVCSWDGAAWHCGCSDAACSAGGWQLQSIQIPSAGGTGGRTATGNFHVAGGKITDPSGNVWHGYGVAIDNTDADNFGAGLAATLQSEFPGINLVRLAGQVGDTPDSYAPFVNAMTAAGAVVVIEHHDFPPKVLTGGTLVAESNWYAGMATYYINNPRVMFETMNEPDHGDADQMAATYAAVRGTGNDTIVFMEAGQGAGGIAGTLGNQSVFGSMHNVGWDLHCYNWQSNYSTDLSTIQADQNSRIATYQAITSADGVMPVLSLETGISTSGTTPDAGGTVEVQATFSNTNLQGATAWGWDNFQALNILTSSFGGPLTDYGHQVAGYIALHR